MMRSIIDPEHRSNVETGQLCRRDMVHTLARDVAMFTRSGLFATVVYTRLLLHYPFVSGSSFLRTNLNGTA